MDWLFKPFHDVFMQRALVACMLIGFTNGFMGGFVVLRRLALMADALSHSLLPGLAVGLILFGLAPGGLFVGGLVAALTVALGAQFLARGSRIKEDTALAILYTVAFSIGIIIMFKVLPHLKTRVSLEDYLVGDILGVSDADLWVTFGISLFIVPLLAFLQRPLMLTLFDPSVARSQGVKVSALNLVLVISLVFSMIASQQAVGVILLLGLLISPAATMYMLCDSYPLMVWGGGVLGMFGSCLGLLLSYWLNLPSGACIALVLGSFFLIAYAFSPRYGILSRLLRRRHFHEQSLARWPGKSAD